MMKAIGNGHGTVGLVNFYNRWFSFFKLVNIPIVDNDLHFHQPEYQLIGHYKSYLIGSRDMNLF